MTDRYIGYKIYLCQSKANVKFVKILLQIKGIEDVLILDEDTLIATQSPRRDDDSKITMEAISHLHWVREVKPIVAQADHYFTMEQMIATMRAEIMEYISGQYPFDDKFNFNGQKWDADIAIPKALAARQLSKDVWKLWQKPDE